LAAGV
jgi:hypothetical protein